MKYELPIWKKWLSYIIELELERLDSDYGHELSLCVSDGRLQLNAKNAIYSWEDKYDNFLKAFKYIFSSEYQYSTDTNDIKDVLVLGLGLASIPQMLEQKFNKNFYYTGVEIDDQVIYLAEKYITHKLQSPMETIQAPAEIFVQSVSQKYGLICVDIFINDTIPNGIKQLDFLTTTKGLLSNDGVLLFNHLANHEEERKTAIEFFENSFKSIFPTSQLLDVEGNFIFIGKY